MKLKYVVLHHLKLQKTAPLWKAFERNIIRTYTFVNENVSIKVLNFDTISFERLIIKAIILQYIHSIGEYC